MHSHNHEFPEMGLGCVNLTRQNNTIIDHALAKGCVLFDTADCYGNGESEIALGEKLAAHLAKDASLRSKLVVCTKVGVSYNAEGEAIVNGSAAYIKEAVEASLKRLQLDYIDIVYLHRTDPNVCIEVSMSALKELVVAGKAKAIGLSEVTSKVIERASKIHPVFAVQNECSPWSQQDMNHGIVEYCRKKNIKLISCSPLGRGFFTDHNAEYFANLPADDYRRKLPRFQPEELAHNLEIRKKLEEFVKEFIDYHKEKNQSEEELECTVARLVLAWMMYHNIVPIPATTDPRHFDENFDASMFKLNAHEYHCLDEIIYPSQYNYKGSRYRDAKQSAIYPAAEVSFWYANREAIGTGIKYFSMFAGAALVAAVAYEAVKKRGNSL